MTINKPTVTTMSTHGNFMFTGKSKLSKCKVTLHLTFSYNIFKINWRRPILR